MAWISINRKWRLACTSIVLGISVACAYHFFKSWSSFKDIALPSPDCDLRKSTCSTSLPTGETISLSIIPTHMPVLTSIQIEVKTEKISAHKVSVEFKGAEMNMGEFRTVLKHYKQGKYTTQTILPTCMHEEMLWHAIVHVESHNNHYRAPFLLVAERPEEQ
jgi:hypothetical protein